MSHGGVPETMQVDRVEALTKAISQPAGGFRQSSLPSWLLKSTVSRKFCKARRGEALSRSISRVEWRWSRRKGRRSSPPCTQPTRGLPGPVQVKRLQAVTAAQRSAVCNKYHLMGNKTCIPASKKHLYNIYTMLEQRLRRWAMVYTKIFQLFKVFSDRLIYLPRTLCFYSQCWGQLTWLYPSGRQMSGKCNKQLSAW